MRPGRLEALVDGVFAIALTLLVLDLPKPVLSKHLGHTLLQQWPSYVAYLVSFVTIGILWIEHHGMMSAVRAIDRRFLERTLAFLLFISIIPWPTALAASYADQGVSEARVAAILYAATMLMMGLTFAWGWRYLTVHPGLVVEPARPAFPAGTRRRPARWTRLSRRHRGGRVQPHGVIHDRQPRGHVLRGVEERGPGSDRPIGGARGGRLTLGRPGQGSSSLDRRRAVTPRPTAPMATRYAT